MKGNKKNLGIELDLFKDEFGENFSKLNDMVMENVLLFDIIEAVNTTPNDSELGAKIRLLIQNNSK